MTTPGVYEHHKGGHYTVLMLARSSTNARPGVLQVVYVSHSGTIANPAGLPLVREEAEFSEMVQWPDGKHHPRFRKVSP